MDSREEVIEAAMLARMVGSHLSGVDQLTVERSNNSANKINMQNFVAPLLGKQQNFNSFNTVGATPDMIRAYEGLNELKDQMLFRKNNNFQLSNLRLLLLMLLSLM